MKILLISRIDSAEALAFMNKLGDELRAVGHSVSLEKETALATGTSGTPLASAASDLVVIIGGDGTILRSVQQMSRQIPLVGINWGEVGFLADLEPEDAREFLLNLKEPLPVEQRMRLRFVKDGNPVGDALNEALIVTSRPAKMLRFSIMIDGVLAEEFRADGLLISSPTGSTAYAMSAGGPIVDPRIDGILLVPLAPYMLSSRPHLISSDRHVGIRLASSKPAHLVLDGQRTVDLGADDVIEVKKSEHPAVFINTGRNFFAKVENKLRRL